MNKECSHKWLYMGGHNEWLICTKCGLKISRLDTDAMNKEYYTMK